MRGQGSHRESQVSGCGPRGAGGTQPASQAEAVEWMSPTVTSEVLLGLPRQRDRTRRT